MRTSKLVFMVMIGLAALEFSCGQLLFAATKKKAANPSIAIATSKAKAAIPAKKSTSSMKGVAAVYADMLQGRKTASGKPFTQQGLTAAHRSLPLGTTVRVTNLRNKRSVDVQVNDRGPWHRGRIIDLSKAAAKELGMTRTGRALVQLEIIGNNATSKS